MAQIPTADLRSDPALLQSAPKPRDPSFESPVSSPKARSLKLQASELFKLFWSQARISQASFVQSRNSTRNWRRRRPSETIERSNVNRRSRSNSKAAAGRLNWSHREPSQQADSLESARAPELFPIRFGASRATGAISQKQTCRREHTASQVGEFARLCIQLAESQLMLSTVRRD